VKPVETLAARFTLRPDLLLRYLASILRGIIAARAAVITETPDIVHANSIRAGLVMSAATFGLGVPLVWHAHDLLPRHLLSTAIRLFALLTGHSRIIAVSDAVADRFRGKVLRFLPRRVPVTTIYNAVDLGRFHPNAESRRKLRSALGIAENQLLIGTVGQLTPRKRQLELIRAFAEAAREIPDVLLMIVGEPIFNRDDEYAASLTNAANASGVSDRIRFLGPREDVPALMRSFDFLVVNSRAEPFGLTITEAMASGTPVVATAVDGIPEIVRHGESGWLISDLNPRSLIEAMLTLLCDPSLRRRLGQHGREQALKRFSSQRFLTETQLFYRSILPNGGMPHEARTQGLETGLTAD